jgi:O-antigen/teichoic acid export membrane protein
MVSRTQKNMDRFICVLAPIALVANTILAAVVVPGDLRRAALIGAVLAAGFGATTTTGVGATFLRGAGILRLEFLQNAQRLLLGAALGYGLGARAGIVGFAVGIALANVVSAFWFRRRSLRMLERLLMRGNSSTNSDRIAEGIDRRE